MKRRVISAGVLATILSFGIGIATFTTQTSVAFADNCGSNCNKMIKDYNKNYGKDETLAAVKKRGYLQCMVRGRMNILSANLMKYVCYGLAKAIFGELTNDDHNDIVATDINYDLPGGPRVILRPFDQVELIPVASTDGSVSELASGVADISTRVAFHTHTRETTNPARATPPILYGTTNIMSKNSEVDGAGAEALPGIISDEPVCVGEGTAFIQTLANLELNALIVPFGKDEFGADYYGGDACQHVIQTDANLGAAQGEDDVISAPLTRENLGGYVRVGDSHWETLVKWVMWAPMEAEACGIGFHTLGDPSTGLNIPDVLPNSSCKNLVNALGNDVATRHFLDAGAFVKVLEVTGSYADLFEQAKNDIGGIERTPLNAQCGVGVGQICARGVY